MLAGIGQYNPKPNVKNYNKPAFTALYFKNEKVQKMAQYDPNFAHILNNYFVGWAIENFHVVVTDVSKLFKKDWALRGCTEVVQKGNDIVPAGVKSPYINKDNITQKAKQLIALNNHENFKNFYFRKEKYSEKLMESNVFYSMLKSPLMTLKDKYKIWIKDVKNDSVEFAICKKITQNKKGENVPEGYFSRIMDWEKDLEDHRVWHWPNDIKDHSVHWYITNLDNIADSFSKIHFVNDKVKQQFATKSDLKDLFLSDDAIRKTVNKYNLVVTGVDKKHISYVVSSDIAQNGNKISPAGFYSSVLRYKDKPGRSHIELEILGPNYLNSVIKSVSLDKSKNSHSYIGQNEEIIL